MGAHAGPNLPGELRVRARYGDLIAQLGEPRNKREEDLYVLMARWLSDEELETLLDVIRRPAEPE